MYRVTLFLITNTKHFLDGFTERSLLVDIYAVSDLRYQKQKKMQ